jgi:hypothetical protein
MSRKQQLAEMLATHLLNQGRKSRSFHITDGEQIEHPMGCAYLGIVIEKDGEQVQLKCGAAPILDEVMLRSDKYYRNCNTATIDDIFTNYIEVVKPEYRDLTKKEQQLVKDFQGVHDDNEPSDWLGKIKELFIRWELDSCFLKNWEG